MRKFHRERGRRQIFMKSLATNFIMKERMETTVERAKELRPRVERLLTVGKQQTTVALRRLLKVLPKAAAVKLYYEIAPRYKDRRGGYTRILKTTRPRKRDGAPTAVIEFISP